VVPPARRAGAGLRRSELAGGHPRGHRAHRRGRPSRGARRCSPCGPRPCATPG
jgi:hypothetical protein